MTPFSINSIYTLSASIDWSASITAIATIVLAILTFKYVRLTREILDSQSDPCIIVSSVHDNDRSSIIQMVLTS